MSDDDLVDCKLCGAAIRRDRRPEHIGWHARLNARTQGLAGQLKELEHALDEMLLKATAK